MNKKTQKEYYMRQIVQSNSVDLNTVAQEIEAMCTLTNADIVAVLASLQETVMKHLREGDSVRLGQIGSFRPAIQGETAPTKEECQKKKILRFYAVFNRSSAMRRALKTEDLKFQEVVLK